jgi:GT2 family glycosyltransferase
MNQALAGFLASNARLDFTQENPPDVSILIILFNQAALTYGCLESLQAMAKRDIELIIVDNASSDQTAGLLARIDGARIIRNRENLHFLRAVNQGAQFATGAFLLLLNNDAVVMANSIGRAVDILRIDPTIGAVGGKIILPDGRLQEAGSILWSDGSALGYGRGDDPQRPDYQFQREVDYCSGAFLMIRRALFEELNRLDPIYAPAYYEETDLCLRLHKQGYRIVYDPMIEILHMEFASSPSSGAALALQAKNRLTFLDRHKDILDQKYPPGSRPLDARDPAAKRRILVIDDCVPYETLGAGMPRAAYLLRTLADLGAKVTFYPRTDGRGTWDMVRQHFPPTIEFMLRTPPILGREYLRELARYFPRPIRFIVGRTVRLIRSVLRSGANAESTPELQGDPVLAAFLTDRFDYYDLIIVSRPHNMAALGEILQTKPDLLGHARLIYDAEALFSPREALRLALMGKPMSAQESAKALAEELALAKPAQGIFAVNELDAEQFRLAGHHDVQVLGHALEPIITPNDFHQRSGLLFIGNMDSDLSPNVDGMIWFAREIAPILSRDHHLDWRLDAIGRADAWNLRRINVDAIHWHGPVLDPTSFYNGARLFIAPTRFAAGIPHKIHEAAARGLPVVATSILAQQLGWEAEQDLLVADSPQDFAAQIARLYQDENLWQRLRTNAFTRVKADCAPDKFRKILSGILADLP